MSKSKDSSRKGSISKLKFSLDKEIPLDELLNSGKKESIPKINAIVHSSLKSSSKKSSQKKNEQETFAEKLLRNKQCGDVDKNFNLNLNLNLSAGLENYGSSAEAINDSFEEDTKNLPNDVMSKGKLSENSKRSQSQDRKKCSLQKKIEGAELGFNFSPQKNLEPKEFESEDVKEIKKPKVFEPNNSDKIFYEDMDEEPEIIKEKKIKEKILKEKIVKEKVLKEKIPGPGRAGVKAIPYCVYEDNLILERFSTKGEKEAMNSVFKSIEYVYNNGTDIPSGLVKRTFESIKTRYTKTLKQLREEDIEKISSYCKENYNNEPLLTENQAVIIRESKNDLSIKEISLIPIGKDKTVTAIDQSDSSSMITAEHNIDFNEIVNISSNHKKASTKKNSVKKSQEESPIKNDEAMDVEIIQESSLIEQLQNYQSNHEIGLVNMCEDSDAENQENYNLSDQEDSEIESEEPLETPLQKYINVKGHKLDAGGLVSLDDMLDVNPEDLQEKTGFNLIPESFVNNEMQESQESEEQNSEDCEEEEEEEHMNFYQKLKRNQPETTRGFSNLVTMDVNHSDSEEDKNEYFNEEELTNKAKDLFQPDINYRVPCVDNDSVEYNPDEEEQQPRSPEFNFSNVEAMQEVDQTNVNNKKIFSNYMGVNREIDINNRVENFKSKINSTTVQDREDVAYTVASFIVSLSKTLGYPVKDYIQHICGHGIPSDMAKVRDQVLAQKVANAN